MQTDVDYYRDRAVTERQMAHEAGRADVALIHLELAKQYQGLVEQAQLREALKVTSPIKLGV